MNSITDKINMVMTQPKKVIVLSKKLGSYNSPVKAIGHYNGVIKRKLGHYNC